MPLELTDNELLGDQPKFEEACSKLMPSGWSSEAKLCSATWVRLRYIWTAFREEVLEYPFRPLTAETVASLKVVAERLDAQLGSLPLRLRYSREIWDSGSSTNICHMSGICHLLYLQSKLHIYHMLEKSNTSYRGSLLSTAAEVVGIVIHMGSVQHRADHVRHDNSYVMLYHGLPAVAALIQVASRNGLHGLPEGLSRPKIIRDLSVFIYNLETICAPNDANYAVCVQAASTFARTLDEILDQTGVQTADLTQSASGANFDQNQEPEISMAQPSPSASDLLSSNDLDMTSKDWDNFDLDAWMRSIDWTGTNWTSPF